MKASAMIDELPTLAVDSRCELGECVLWCERRSALFWTDIVSARLWMHVPHTGLTTHWGLPVPLGCLALCSDGHLLLGLAKGLFLVESDLMESSPVPFDINSDTASPKSNRPLLLRHIVDVEAERSDTRINDGRSDRHGNFVFGTKHEGEVGPPGRFYQFSFQHGLRVLALPNAAIPNSICFGLDGRTMYFCDSRIPEILCCDYDPDEAVVSRVRVFTRIDLEGASPDGSVIDAEGCLWNAQWGAGRVVRYRPDGSLDAIVKVPVINPSCCTLGGPAFDQLYVSTAREDMDAAAQASMPHAGGIYRVELKGVGGLPESRVAAAS
jgi:sugar lactone lactonase YvrE